ncbi:UNVERIFIED_CONTAM: hypothetical protein K2H54_031790 [Gekko kuhli]
MGQGDRRDPPPMFPRGVGGGLLAPPECSWGGGEPQPCIGRVSRGRSWRGRDGHLQRRSSAESLLLLWLHKPPPANSCWMCRTPGLGAKGQAPLGGGLFPVPRQASALFLLTPSCLWQETLGIIPGSGAKVGTRAGNLLSFKIFL